MKKCVFSLFFIISVWVAVYALPSDSYAGGQGQDMAVEELIRQNRQLMEENKRLSARLENVEKNMEQMQATVSAQTVERLYVPEEGSDGERPWYERFSIGFGATGVLQALGNNGDNPNGGDQADAAYTVDLNLEADFGDYGDFFVHLEGGDGEGPNNNVPSFSVPNYDAYITSFEGQSALTISEVFYEKGFFDDMFLFDIGKMDISVLFDENEAAGDETTQFLSNIFVKSMGLTIPEPDDFYAPAMMFAAAPAEWLEWRVVGASVDNTKDNMWEDVFSNGFIATQMNFCPEFAGLKGNYRFYGWYDSRRYGNNRDLNLLNTDPSRIDGEADKELAGWGLSFDQMLTDGITAFTRYSWSQDDRVRWNGDDEQWEMHPFNQVYSLGLSVSGIYWKRPEDAMGFAFGQTILTNDYEDDNRDTGNESYVETYYRYTFNSNLALSADFQWVGNPGGSKDNDDIYIFGLRGQIDF